jgi:hypothetical protein
MLKRTDPPSETLLSETALSERSVVRRLWQRVRPDGATIDATLWWNNSLGEACVELTVRSAHATDTLAESLAKGVLATIDGEGARPPEPPPQPKAPPAPTTRRFGG